MLTSTKPPQGKFLRKKDVCAITSLSPQQLQEEIKQLRFEPGTRLTANSNILVWTDEYVFGWMKRRWEARGSPEDVARGEMCAKRAKNAVAHRIAKNKKRGAR